MKMIFLLTTLVISGLNISGQNDLSNVDESGLTPQLVMSKTYPQTLNPAKGGNAWTPIGPFGGDVVDMAVSVTDPEIVFAAAGIPYRSTDGGQNWSAMENLLTPSPSGIGTFESSSNGVVFASGPYTYYKIFKSTDNGLSWTQKSIPVNGAALDIKIDPANPNIVYAGLTSISGSASNNVIIKSVNGGDSWTWFDLTSVLPAG